MSSIASAIIVVKTVILLLGGAITYIAYRAYRRTHSASLQMLGIGFAVITLGAFLTGGATLLFTLSLEAGVLINSIFVAVGLAVIMYSLHLERG
ncbi:DUF7521 family protein [Halorarius litoreus]|uniref:DUF7521 family protein n=1 Tax=Halorarius litoreus TaxID=2962676 RepID=UPI0020CF7185|nr:hypothetical protein [Halorarius litoreus]